LPEPLPEPNRWEPRGHAFHPFCALLVSHLTTDELEAAMRRPTTADSSLGAVWEADGTHFEGFAIRKTRSFCIRENSDAPFSLEYCGMTCMSDETIMHKGSPITAKYLNSSCPDHK
jgi:hypothetical protein